MEASGKCLAKILETEKGGQITAYVCELESLNW